MKERFVTLAEGDSRLEDHLNGWTSNESMRPVLIESLNPGLKESLREWTFEYVPVAELGRPSLLKVWLQVLRPETWVLSLAPMLATLGWLMATEHDLKFLRVVEVVLGIICLHASINLFDDYHDHMRGWGSGHRVGTRVLSRGWLRAQEVYRIAWLLFAIATALGLIVLITHFSPAGLIAIVAFLAGLEFAVSKIGLKYKGLAEIVSWFMFGPLLTGGFAWALSGEASFRSFLLGSFFGSLALLAYHLKNFERILVDGQAKMKTWPVQAGFDASKTFAVFCAALTMASFALVLVFVDPVPEKALALIALVMGLGPLVSRVRSLRSPVAGEMRGLYRSALRLTWIVCAANLLGDLIRLYGTQLLGALF